MVLVVMVLVGGWNCGRVDGLVHCTVAAFDFQTKLYRTHTRRSNDSNIYRDLAV